ncbi:MAG TPA: DUF992 domain-containing protein [Caulobacteraceae bacterium]|nr:DUF992 domain-containing protein [Caulobacteraceae bacterium]
MKMLHRPILGALAVGVVALAAASSANAQAPDQSGVRAGVLSCDEASGWGLVVTSSREVNCTFSNNDGRVVAHYTGHIDKFGVDIGYHDAGVLIWGVIAPTTGPKPGSLDGTYVGVTAGATVGVGAGANLLVGGSDRSISLQPLSVEGTTGLNIAAGVAGLTLHYVAS